VAVVGKEKLGLDLEQRPQPPPRFLKDTSRAHIFSKKAIDVGWHLVAVNAIDTQGMSAMDPRLRGLLQKRPCILTFRATKDINVGNAVLERGMTDGKRVQLSGLPKELDPKVSPLDRNQLTKKLGPIRFTRVPKPTPVIPNPADLKRLNLHPARAAILDVRGIVKALFGAGPEDAEDDSSDHARASVDGILEDSLPAPYFDSIPLKNGQTEVGSIKIRVHCLDYVWPEWPQSLAPTHPATFFYDNKKFRKWIKLDTPAVFRVRSYVIRGINVSGATSGHGNPYLYFMYGQMPVKLPGQRQMHTTEPRFFRTEERDVKFPEQSYYEVGLYDFADSAVTDEDDMIGKSFVDLEDRWFSKEYQMMVSKNVVPIEYRPMASPKVGSLCKGSLEMWIDLMDASAAADVPLKHLLFFA
jgi:hypothetical protein